VREFAEISGSRWDPGTVAPLYEPLWMTRRTLESDPSSDGLRIDGSLNPRRTAP
jgi:hypothetical protein